MEISYNNGNSKCNTCNGNSITYNVNSNTCNINGNTYNGDNNNCNIAIATLAIATATSIKECNALVLEYMSFAKQNLCTSDQYLSMLQKKVLYN